MFRTKHTLARLAGGLAVAASLVALCAPTALGRTVPYGGHDPWFTNAVSPGGHDPWFNYAVSLGQDRSAPFITDTLAPGGVSAPVESYRFTTDTLAPGGGVVASGPATSGFDWSDAGIGAAGTVGLMLVLLGGARVRLHRRSVIAT